MHHKKILFIILVLFSAQMILVSCGTPKTKHAYMRKTYKKLKRSLKSSAQVSHMNDTVKVIFPSNLMFGFNSASISETVVPKMQRFAGALNKFDRTSILISGHTDNKGTDEYNNELSSKRADSTKIVLALYNVQKDRINTWGMGMRYPVAPNDTEEGRARNRRVEFVILYKE
jgi:outer membrane protein OmpA-like peptidoglycan-associated protein